MNFLWQRRGVGDLIGSVGQWKRGGKCGQLANIWLYIKVVGYRQQGGKADGDIGENSG